METAEPHVKAEDDGSADKPKQSSPSAAFSWMAPAKKSDVKREENAEKKVDITPREFCWLAHNCGWPFLLGRHEIPSFLSTAFPSHIEKILRILKGA